ncbi:unnamed protein product [Hyaloperonospora brassicae]|uniref:PX domain-containing protein n=1 Tax=Hyaloperonospora brassicae TaxID=162125 RepID=A0AAV0UNG8_HYABA|nr:unnamed protein product [Hyaloperonospora brassicae]
MRIVAPTPAPPSPSPSSTPFYGFRYSEPVIFDHVSSSSHQHLPATAKRNSLAALDHLHATKGSSNNNSTAAAADLYLRHDSSCTSETSGFDGVNLWNVDEELEAAPTPTAAFHPSYQGVAIAVTHHSVNNQGVVMYHVDIKGPDGFLSTYTIRRRFRAFKNLYTELHRLVIAYQQQQTAHRKAVEAAQQTTAAALSLDRHIPLSPHSAFAAAKSGPPVSSTNYSAVTFPALPSAGVWSFFKRHDVRLVEQRKLRFQEILTLAIRHPATRNSTVLDAFLSVAPSEISQRGSSYVSLQDYSVPAFDQHRESIERRQRKMQLLHVRRLRAGSDSQFSDRTLQ